MTTVKPSITKGLESDAAKSLTIDDDGDEAVEEVGTSSQSNLIDSKPATCFNALRT